MICPKCGGNNIVTTPITNTCTQTKVKGFGCIKACIGFFLFNIPGILCGLCGMGKSKTKTISNTKLVHICQDCGHNF